MSVEGARKPASDLLAGGHEVTRNLNTIPGFTAETSIYGTKNRYRTSGVLYSANQMVHPADYVDPMCLDGCMRDCTIECADMFGSGKAACIRMCGMQNRQCYAICTRPGDPPPPPPVSPCAPGVLCPNGSCCPAGTQCCNNICCPIEPVPGIRVSCSDGTCCSPCILGNCICCTGPNPLTDCNYRVRC